MVELYGRTLSCHCPVKLLAQCPPCIFVCYSVYFWLIRSFTDPAFTGPLHHHVLLSSIFWGRRSFQIRYAAHLLHGLAMIFLRDSLSVRRFLNAAMTWYSGFFQLSLVTRFACDIGQLARIWIWVSSEVITIWVSVWISVDQLNTS